MTQVDFVESMIKPLVQSGVYKDESSALKALIVDYIDRKREEYDTVISKFEKKYQKDFDEFSRGLLNTATIELEDDWMEWKGAIEMRKSWDEAYRLSIHGKAV